MLKTFALFGGLVVAIAVGTALFATGSDPKVAWTAGVVTLCALWWIFEPIPIAATSLIPLAIFPAVGVLTTDQIGQSYGSPLVLLMLGGFMLSVAMEKSNTHRRLALSMVNAFGGGGRSLVFGFMTASAVLSMWISNAATALMMLPIVMAVADKTSDVALRTSLLLGVAYASSIGGIGTPVGTPPNLVFMKHYTKLTGSEPTFLQWMSWALPIVVVMIPIAGLWLTRGIKTKTQIELPTVGQWRTEEVRTLAVFAVTALLWITRGGEEYGWSYWLGLPNANDASVALLAAVAMHFLPNGNTNADGKREMLLDWPSAVKIPWGILILYGGGIAIAEAFTESGLSDMLRDSLSGLASVPVVLMIAGLCLAVTFLTEVTSNTATATLLLPVLALAAVSAKLDPRLIMVPATISCSFAFMLPVATPPNAIMFGSEQLTIKTMAREGFVLNLIGVVVVTAICLWNFAG
ncbi:SLC13 family permease [Stieleria varia]|uniref:Sodium-dependent dicarboxylate transporter SdcS n=1 Tax=Stieleria varia TaxID=2528005 RepID=A0A5C6AMC0_9BACT|nr:SLC13 family permease [Stieleria varia]TWU01203.1 Sodium-dependent dicarboxylate transporter SdcS [Stieleria varia]